MQNKIALITGSGRGIGAETARLLALKGCRVVITSRTVAEIEKTVEKIASETRAPERVFGIASDIENPKSILALFSAVEKKWGPVEILVNNAAVGFSTDFFELDLLTYEKIQNINVRGSFLCAQRMMKALRAAKKSGAVVNLSSLGGIRSTDKFKGTAPYVMSKFAIVGMTEALAVEGKPYEIRVNAVAPGAVDTEMLKKAAPHLKTNTKPIDIAHVIVSLCDEESSGAVSGSTVEVFSNG